MLHKSFGTAQEEGVSIDFIELPGYELATEMAHLSVIRPCRNDNALKVGETCFQELQLTLENDVLHRAHAVEENDFSVQATVVDVPKDR